MTDQQDNETERWDHDWLARMARAPALADVEALTLDRIPPSAFIIHWDWAIIECQIDRAANE